jgi:hypothetical protein
MSLHGVKENFAFNFYIGLLSALVKKTLPFRISDQNFVHFSGFLHSCCISLSSHLPGLIHTVLWHVY